MKTCLICDTQMICDFDDNYCLKHYAEKELTRATGLSTDDLPDCLPLEDFIDDDGNLMFDEISAY